VIIQAFQVFDQLIIQVIQVIQVIRRSVAVSDRWSRHVVVDGNWRRLWMDMRYWWKKARVLVRGGHLFEIN